MYGLSEAAVFIHSFITVLRIQRNLLRDFSLFKEIWLHDVTLIGDDA